MEKALPQNKSPLLSQPYLSAAPLQAWVPCIQRKPLGRWGPGTQLPPLLLHCQGESKKR